MSPFSEIVERTREASVVFENDACMAIMDIHPISKGHVILFAKKNAANIFEVEEEIIAEMGKALKKICLGMKDALQCDGINIFSNNGKAAQQTIFHFSYHIIPRWRDDNIRMLSRDSQFSSQADMEELQEIAKTIKKKIS